MRLVTVLVALLAFAGCQPTPDAPARAFSVANGFIRDEYGRAVIMRGANVAQSHKTPPYFGFHRAADFARLREDWGFNAVRLLVEWAAVEPQRGSIDAAYLDALVERLRWARQAGLLVVLDMHQDVFGEGFGHNGAPRWACDEQRYRDHQPRDPWFLNYSSPQVMACFDALYRDDAIVERFGAAWRAVAERVRREGDLEHTVVGFDVLNEPHWGSTSVFKFEATVLAPFYARVVGAVREAAPDWLAFVEPANSRNLGIASSLPRPSFGHVVYAPHSYDPNAESGNGFDPARADALKKNIAAMAREAATVGGALWIGEYGGNPDEGGIDAYMGATYDGAGAVAAGAMVWEYGRGGGYALLDADGNERAALLDALVRPYPARVAGDPLDYRFEAASKTLVVRYVARAAVREATEIIAPARVYPRGVDVDCEGGCSAAYDEDAQVVKVSGGRDGETIVVTVTPR
ncbi:MAG: cellulase family glycosylhydrolase [Myxococcales bacterium]|nr:cellulase family glycosylhydrolase [Myxococcales bacterium]